MFRVYEDLLMKTCFTFAIVSLIAAGTAFGREIAADGTQSVLVQPKTTVVTTAPAIIVETVPCRNGRCHKSSCANGQCSTRLFSVEEKNSESCRNRLFGGTVVRKNSRTVVRPVR